MQHTQQKYITVSALSAIIKELLVENLSEVVKIKGEVSNFKISNNNCFFTLKDATSAISVLSWGNTFSVENGDDIIVTGKVGHYAKQGTYNLQAYSVEKVGTGNIHETCEKLKQKFDKQGLFSKKRPFPTTINKIGIVSAYGGAALQDVLYVLKANMFSGDVLIKNCYAQGKYCSKSIKTGIEFFNNAKNKVDLILITRGGGSLEDLMGYSEEIVINAIWNSDIFTISAVGHEIDTMLSDYAADHRSPTPTRAAEEISDASKKIIKNFELCSDIVNNLKSTITKNLLTLQTKITANKSLLNALSPSKCIDNQIKIMQNLKHMLYNKFKNKIDTLSFKLESLKLETQLFDTINNFHKGFVMIVDEKGKIIKSATEFKLLKKNKQKLKYIFADGEVLL